MLFLDTFIMVLSRFDNTVEILNNHDPVTEVKFGELSEIIFSPDVCQLNLENRNNLLNYMVGQH